MDESLAPTGVDRRIDTLDVLRGVAICGILLMNIPVMGTLGDNEGLTYPARWNADLCAWIVQQVFFEGTMRGLFTMLFGAGMLLMLRRAEGADARVAPFDVWARRCLALMAFGVIQFAVFFWPGEILWTYGLAGFALLAFRLARPRALLIAAAILLAALSGFRAYQTGSRVALFQASVAAEAAKAAGRTLDARQQAAIDAVKEAKASFYPTPAKLAEEKARRTALPGLLGWSWEGWAERHVGPYSWLGVAEQIAFMLVGMALFRTGVLTGTAPAATYRRLMIWGYGIGLALRIAGIAWQARTGFELDVHRIVLPVSYARAFLYEPARLAVTLGHVGLVVALFRAGALGAAWPLRALGRMALTVYSLQSILTSLLFYLLGTVGAFGFAALMAISAGIWIVTATISVWWLDRNAMGPAERLLRAIAYGRPRTA